MIDDHAFFSGVGRDHPGYEFCLECGEHVKQHTHQANCVVCGDGQVKEQIIIPKPAGYDDR